MKTIWKYSLDTTDEQEIQVPEDAKIVSFQVQYGFPCIWVLVDPSNYTVTRKFRILKTGHPVEEDGHVLEFIGTYQIVNGTSVFHLFEVR